MARRGLIEGAGMLELHAVMKELRAAPEINVVRIKDRFLHP